MRAVSKLKNSNLNWCIVLQHFKKYSKLQSLDIESSSSINESMENNIFAMVLDNYTKGILNNAPTPVINKGAFEYPLPGTIYDIQNNSIESTSTMPYINLLNDRYVHQMDIISGAQLYDNSDVVETNDTTIDTGYLECTTHSCLLPLRRDLSDLFPGRDLLSEDSPLTVVCLNHQTQENMSNWDSAVVSERLMLANLFVKSSMEICASLTKCGFWADFIDPFSGTPFYGEHTNDTLFETDPRMRNFGLHIRDLGCCKVLCHPLWRENVFTGLIFTDAPSDHPILALSSSS